MMRTRRWTTTIRNQVLGRNRTYPSSGRGIGKRLSPPYTSTEQNTLCEEEDINEEENGAEEERTEENERPYSKNLRGQFAVIKTTCNCAQLQSRCQQHPSTASTMTPKSHSTPSTKANTSSSTSPSLSVKPTTTNIVVEMSLPPTDHPVVTKTEVDHLKLNPVVKAEVEQNLEQYPVVKPENLLEVIFDELEGFDGIDADFNILEYADPELDLKTNILDSLDWNLI